jgi:hypothetical protein
METNGVYHLPLQNLKNTKTYKADAFVIASFGEADMKEIEIKRDNMSKETQVKACARIGQEIGKDIARVKIQLKSN